MSRLASLTYGPTPRTVAIQRLDGSGPPEILDSGATIARRTIELSDPFENAGAMLVRDTLLRVHERVGDGTALTAVLLHALLCESATPLAGGVDPIELRPGIAASLNAVRAALQSQVRPVEEVTAVRALMASLVVEPPVVELLAEVLEAIGSEGVVMVENGRATETTREYLDGVRWDEGYLSTYFDVDGSGAAHVLEPAVLVTDQAIERPDQLVPLLELCVATGRRKLLIVAPGLGDRALRLLLTNRERGVLEGVVAVKAPAQYDEQHRPILEDLAVLTGGRCLRAEAGDRIESVSAADLGSARQAWARQHTFAILGAAGDRSAIRARALAVRAQLSNVHDNHTQRRWLERRLANLSGVAAVVRVGGATDAERDARRLRVEAAVRSGGLALRAGVVPGGGVALANCADALAQATVPERMLTRALSSPLRLIARLAGCEPGVVVAQVSCHPGLGFDAIRQTWTPELVDPYAVIWAALEASIGAAATAMSAHAIIRRSS